MSSVTDNATGPEPAQAAASQTSSAFPVSPSPVPVFLMIDSLQTGGTERQFSEIARSLGKDFFQVHLGCLQKKGPFLEGLGELHLSEPGGSLYSLTSIRSRWKLVRHLRESRIAIAHAFDFYANLMLIPAAKLAGVPVIGSHRQLGDLLSPAKFRAQLTMFRWCDRVVCNSQAAADRLLQAGLEENKLVVIGNALPPTAFAETAPALKHAEGILRVGMIARMNAEYKNQSLFLRAAARVAPRFPNVEFLLVGDGPLRPQLERQAAELGVQSQVRFLGDRRDIPAILASMDISVVPSASESLSNVMLESMAAGVPVVATAVGETANSVPTDGRCWFLRTTTRLLLRDSRVCWQMMGCAGKCRTWHSNSHETTSQSSEFASNTATFILMCSPARNRAVASVAGLARMRMQQRVFVWLWLPPVCAMLVGRRCRLISSCEIGRLIRT